MKRMTNIELDELRVLYARDAYNQYAPPAVNERTAQIRSLIDEVKMWRKTAGEETE